VQHHPDKGGDEDEVSPRGWLRRCAAGSMRSFAVSDGARLVGLLTVAGPRQFKAITTAYEILSDEQKRSLYDQGGLEAVESGGGGGDAEDIFSAFFGGRGRRQKGPRKGEDLVHPIQVTPGCAAPRRSLRGERRAGPCCVGGA
jgi:curved DNA-binding protein CbpA